MSELSAGPGGLPAELVDFLYRDTNRLNSFYAQLFRGRLSLFESGTISKSHSNAKVAGSIGVAAGSMDTTKASENSYKESFDPHDFALVEAMVGLSDAGLIALDPVLANNGELILVKGSVMFIDRHVLRFGKIGMQALVAAEKSKPRKQQDTASIYAVEELSKLIDHIELPSLFILTTDTESYGGSIKEPGLEEPITSYYYRYGGRALPDIWLLGVKEQPVTSNALSGGLFGQLGDSLDAMQSLGLPPEAQRVTPIALFRKLIPPCPPESEPDPK